MRLLLIISKTSINITKRESVLEEKVLEENTDGNPTKIYTRFKMPMMSERESLVKLDMKENLTGEHAGKCAWIISSYEDPAYPINPKLIRMTTF
jgi:hypothetical protein